MWEISKQISFCYGHRVHTQKLEEEFCSVGDSACKCKHRHGHQGELLVYLEGHTNHQGFVTDFKHLGWLKDLVDKYWDHKFIIDINDPGFEMLMNGSLVFNTEDYIINNEPVTFKKPQYLDYKGIHIPLSEVKVEGVRLGWTVEVSSVPNIQENLEIHEVEILEGNFLVDVVPTSENLAHLTYKIAKAKMAKINVNVSKILWQETPKSQAVYKGN